MRKKFLYKVKRRGSDDWVVVDSLHGLERLSVGYVNGEPIEELGGGSS